MSKTSFCSDKLLQQTASTRRAVWAILCSTFSVFHTPVEYTIAPPIDLEEPNTALTDPVALDHLVHYLDLLLHSYTHPGSTSHQPLLLQGYSVMHFKD